MIVEEQVQNKQTKKPQEVTEGTSSTLKGQL